VPFSEVHSKDNVVTALGEDLVLSDVPLNRPFLRIFLFEFNKKCGLIFLQYQFFLLNLRSQKA
jgi:hypothetical protein